MTTTAVTRAVIEVAGRRVGDAPRTGEILETLGDPAQPHYLVRWEDGHESVLFPSSDAHVRRIPVQPTDLPAGAEPVVEALTEADVTFELLPHRRTHSAAGSATALGVAPAKSAKTIVVRDEDGCARVLVPASKRLDLTRLGAVLGTTPVLLTELELDGAYPQFELGAVPPVGGPAGDRVVVDAALGTLDELVFEAGSHLLSLRMATRDLVAVTAAEVAAIAV